jgi:leucyl aminopeptidase
MTPVHRTPRVVATNRQAATIDVDVWVLPHSLRTPVPAAIDRATDGELGRAVERGEFTGAAFETSVARLTGWKARYVVLVGVGAAEGVTAGTLRRAATVGALAARGRKLPRVGVLVPDALAGQMPRAVQSVVEGVIVANYDGGTYKTTSTSRFWIEECVVRVDAADSTVTDAAEVGRVLGECTNVTRELANLSGNILTPRAFAARATTLARAAGLAVEVLDEKRAAKLGMGLLLGVARGSAEPPRVVVLRHEPKRAPKGPVLGLVGKGVTFDTGGISIKPAENMDKMKDDMSGAAAVLSAMTALARLKVPVRAVAVIPLAENMPGSRAVKPGDILVSAEGKTVEVLNTDAEGRLLLGDALWYARRLGATHLVDVATLTGACVVALGKTTSGLFGRPTSWVDAVRSASELAGDRMWPMPVFDDYKDQFESDIADFANTGGRPAGSITAALFVKEFAGDLPWAHLDIAGTAWAETAKPYQPKGATGVATRTLVELALQSASWGTLK